MTVDDVVRELERLLFRGRYRDALDRVQRLPGTLGHDTLASPTSVRVVILEAAQNVPGIALDPRLLAIRDWRGRPGSRIRSGLARPAI